MVRRKDIVAALRTEIIEGIYKPGAVFPTRAELQKRFQTTPVTIQHAVDVLRRDGFVYSAARRATYVSQTPPHLFKYAMVFSNPQAVLDRPGSRFFQTLVTAAASYDGSEREPRKVAVFFSIDFERNNRESNAFLSSARAHCFAGCIFPEHPFVTGIARSPLCQVPGLPCVALMDSANDRIGAVSLDGDSFINKALDALAARKRKRLAVLSNLTDPSVQSLIFSGAARRNMSIRPYWWLAVSISAPQFAHNAVHLLFAPTQNERPDALLITDDNLLEYAIAGIIAAGMRVPDDLDVVAHCNFPCPGPGVVPVIRLGYDSRAIIKACIKNIDMQRKGNRPSTEVVQAVFEHELSWPDVSVTQINTTYLNAAPSFTLRNEQTKHRS